MITLFTIPRAFTGEDKIRQENTLGSWTRLDPRPEIILFCDDPGVAEAAEQFGCIHVPDIRCNEDGIPFIGDAFRLASQMASNNILCYANADIIFIQDFIIAAKTVAQNFNDPFLIVGQRRDIALPGPLKFADGWKHRLRTQARKHGSLHSPSAMDYFIYSPRDAVVEMPDFLVGSPKWDNWLVDDAEKRGLQVVSATAAVTCIHQRHKHRWSTEGAHYNHRVWWKSGAGVGYTHTGTWVLGPDAKLRGEVWVAPPGMDVKLKPRRGPKRKFKSKPRARPRSKPKHKPQQSQKTRPPRPPRAAPKDELGLPLNVNIPAQELATSAKKLRRQADVKTPGRKRKKHSHSGPSEREVLLAERAKLRQIKDTVRAARIAARDARLAERKKKRP